MQLNRENSTASIEYLLRDMILLYNRNTIVQLYLLTYLFRIFPVQVSANIFYLLRDRPLSCHALVAPFSERESASGSQAPSTSPWWHPPLLIESSPFSLALPLAESAPLSITNTLFHTFLSIIIWDLAHNFKSH